jgi:uncharacterized membrane protein YjfL (UPF0719 family)
METLFADIKLAQVISTIFYSFLGLLLFIVGFFIVEILTPFSLRKEILEQQNTGVAMIISAFLIAMGLILAAVID